MVAEAVLAHRRRLFAGSSPSDDGEDDGGRAQARARLHDLSGGTPDHDRRSDESLREPRDDRRQGGRDDPADQDRRAGIFVFLQPRRRRPAPAVPQSDLDRPAAAEAPPAEGDQGTRAAHGGRRATLRYHGALAGRQHRLQDNSPSRAGHAADPRRPRLLSRGRRPAAADARRLRSRLLRIVPAIEEAVERAGQSRRRDDAERPAERRRDLRHPGARPNGRDDQLHVPARNIAPRPAQPRRSGPSSP